MVLEVDYDALSWQRVNCGVALLDDQRPGWERSIDLSTFDMYDVELCVVGQVYGNYDLGLDALGIRGSGMNYGFASYSADLDGPKWKQVIADRQTLIVENEN